VSGDAGEVASAEVAFSSRSSRSSSRSSGSKKAWGCYMRSQRMGVGKKRSEECKGVLGGGRMMEGDCCRGQSR
jgi:hypothetical protein